MDSETGMRNLMTERAEHLLTAYLSNRQIARESIDGREWESLLKIAAACALRMSRLEEACMIIKENRISTKAIAEMAEADTSRRSLYNHPIRLDFIEYASRLYNEKEPRRSEDDEETTALKEELEKLYRKDDQTERLKQANKELVKELDLVKSQLNIIQEVMGDDMPTIKDGKGIDIREYLKLKDKNKH